MKANECTRSCFIAKFGGASLASLSLIDAHARYIAERSRNGEKVVVVVSAMGEMTDELDRLAHLLHPAPPKRELDMLLTVGERISLALFTIALAKYDCLAISFTGSQSGIITSSDHNDAKILDVRPHRVQEELASGKVVVVAGYQGVSRGKEITTIGRGGSDTTAVALAIALRSVYKMIHVEYFKDVDGVYTQDPNSQATAQKLPFIDYQTALHMTEKNHFVLHRRAIILAARNQIALLVRAYPALEKDGEFRDEPVVGSWIGFDFTSAMSNHSDEEERMLFEDEAESKVV